MIKHVSVSKKIRSCKYIVAANIKNMINITDDENAKKYFQKHIAPYSIFFGQVAMNCKNSKVKSSAVVINVMVVDAIFGVNSLAWRDSFLPCVHTKDNMKYFKFVEKEVGCDYRYISMDSDYQKICLDKFSKSKHKAKVIMYFNHILKWLSTSSCNLRAMNLFDDKNKLMQQFKAQLEQMASDIFSYDKNDDDDCIRLYFHILTLEFVYMLYMNSEGFIKKLIKQIIYDNKEIIAK